MKNKKTKNNPKAIWGDGIAREYAKLIIPNRPSLGDCANYGKLISEILINKKKPRILLMGSTPELRQLLYTYEYLKKATVYCLDIDPKMYQAMRSFINYSHKFREIYVKGSWLDAGFKDGFFDLVIGDEVICNIEAKKHKNLFEEISRILEDGGYWITRHNLYLPVLKNQSIRGILLDLTKKIAKGRYSFQQAMNLLYIFSFYTISANYNITNTTSNHLHLMKKEYQKNLKNHQNKVIIKELIKLYEAFFVSITGDYQWWVLSKEESEKELKKYFEIENTLYASDYETIKCSPIYLLRKKERKNV